MMYWTVTEISKTKFLEGHTCPIYTNGYDPSNRWSIGTNGKAHHSSGSIGEYASQ